MNLLKDVPYIHNTNELATWLKSVYVIEDEMQSIDNYDNLILKMRNIIRACLPIRECREYPVKFKFYKKDRKTYTLELRHFFINLICWEPFLELSDLDILTEKIIIDCYKDIPDIDDYINKVLITSLRDYHVEKTKSNYAISKVLYNLRSISIDFSLILGLNFSMNTFLKMYEDYPEIAQIMEVKFDETMQPVEIEQKVSELQKRSIELYKNDNINPIGVIFRAKTGIKPKQFSEFTIAESLKPTVDGITIPEPIENSTLLKGLDRPSYLYIDGTGARKALIANKKVMGRAGYFGRSCLMLSRTLRMSKEISDCGSTHLVPYEIKTAKHLDKLNGKFYKENLEDFDLELLDGKNDKHLIGKTIYVRSAATCRLGDKICPKCMGLTAITNYDIADGVGGFESEEVSKVVNQNVLSTKHLLVTNSDPIVFNKEFDDFFIISSGEINPIVSNNEVVDNIDDYAIYINPADIIKIEEHDEDSLYNTCIENGRFYVRNIKDSSIADIEIKLEGDKEIYISEESVALMKKYNGIIPFKELDDDTKLFEIIYMNNELTRPLYMLMDLLNKEKKDDLDFDINTISQTFLDLLVEGGIPAKNIAAEIMINRLIRSLKNMYERPSFDGKEIEPYRITTIRYALENNKSPIIGISYQNIKRQILSEKLFTERDSTSYLDDFFKTEISTDNFKSYNKFLHSED